MSLATDKFFFNALAASDDIEDVVDGRIFNPARSTADEDEDKVPYIIITLDSVQNIVDTKDNELEGEDDTVQVSILCVADDRESLAELTEMVRTQCREYWEGAGASDTEAPEWWTFSASGVYYDDMKPCTYQTLTYNCETKR